MPSHRRSIIKVRATIIAMKAMGVLTTEALTRELWQHMTDEEKAPLLETTNMVEQLIGKEGFLLEVIDDENIWRARRFVLGVTNHWQPYHIEQGGARHGFRCPRKGYFSVEVVNRNPSKTPNLTNVPVQWR